ncbi:hypothetical protein P879_07395 [Paragonimus westermani]|uniref:BPTI/Kunitz inhibitor domain-containing protein n=1 Tax=Paragonimus westermani TaxID=34504 RepID=A0A8T0DL40_9TREM|nr:hypothetical protein P879_07395 [Paragonimus westermani]
MSCRALTVTILPAYFCLVLFQNCCALQQHCLLPIEPGPCLAFFRRFAYDADSEQCIEFIYGGCGGNKNKFASLEECESQCGWKFP